MSKVVDFNRSIYELTKDYPELIPIMEKLGFSDLTENISSVEKNMTIPESAKVRKISMGDIVAALIVDGFELAGSMPMDMIPGNEQKQNAAAYKKKKTAELVSIPGHPLHSLTLENRELSQLLEKINDLLKSDSDIMEVLMKIREISIHYAKKGDLLYPHLKVKYKIAGPSDVMWTADDEIRDEMNALVKDTIHNQAWRTRLQKVLKRVEDMIYQEANILFPICAVNFTEEEWIGIYHDSKDYADCFGVKRAIWDLAEKGKKEKTSVLNGEVVMPGGHMTVEQLTALLNTIPIEITFVDEDNINRFFNEGPKVFKRPGMAIDREVFSCHPPKIEGMVRSIIDDFRHNRRDRVPVWMDKNGKSFLVTYMAVRDHNKKYLGTVELVQDMEFAKEHFANIQNRTDS